MEPIRDFQNLRKNDTAMAGGKGASLSGMIQFGILIPRGFVILSSGFDNFVKQNFLDDKIKKVLSEIDFQNTDSIDKASARIKNLIIKLPLSSHLENQIIKKYRELRLKNVAVRSSATAEDSLDTSWAGALESYLNVAEKNLLFSVKKCWASLFTPRAIIYSKEKRIIDKNSVAVVIQQMINSKVSGVCFTQNPVTKNKNQIVIEAGYGIGEALVRGTITPDRYLIKKDELIIEDVSVGLQKIIIEQAKNGVRKSKIERKKQFKQKLNGRQIIDLASVCKNIEKLYKYPQDIEWAFDNNKFYIVQSRPITVYL